MRGRPKIKEEKKRKFFGITVSPTSAARLEKIEGNKSRFIDVVLSRVPDSWFETFNRSPEIWSDLIKPLGK